MNGTLLSTITMPFFLKLIELTDRAICEPSSLKRLTKSSLDMQLNDPFRHISKPSNSLAVLEEDSLDLFGPGWWFVSKTSNDSGMKRVFWFKHSWTHVRLIIQHLFVMACRNFSVRSAQFCGLTLTTKWVTFLSIAFFSLKSNVLMKFKVGH